MSTRSKAGVANGERPPTPITPALLRRWPLPAPDGEEGKEERGRILVVGGSDEIPGAALLAGHAALRAGAGKLVVATSRSTAISIAVATPEARVIGVAVDRKGELAATGARALHGVVATSDAVLVGPGMRGSALAAALLARAMRASVTATWVIDAGPLPLFGGSRPIRADGAKVVLTPHAGEMAKLRGLERATVIANPLRVAREAARDTGAVIALKGAVTYVVAPDGSAFVNRDAGCAGLGTSGSGDVLAGIVAGLAARGADPVQSACWAVYLHGASGDRLARTVGPLGFLAREIADPLPALLAELSSG